MATHFPAIESSLTDKERGVRDAAVHALRALDSISPSDLCEEWGDAFAHAPGLHLASAAHLFGYHTRRSRVLRSSDLEAAEKHERVAQKYEQLAACLVATLSSDATTRLLRSRRGRAALETLLRLGCKGPVSRPNLQSALRVLWQGEGAARQTAEAATTMLFFGIPLVCLTGLVVVIVAPGVVRVLVEVPQWARLLQLATHLSLATLYDNFPFDRTSRLDEAAPAIARALVCALSAWSALHYAAPTLAPSLLASLETHPWWLRVLEGLLPLGVMVGGFVVALRTNTSEIAFVAALAFFALLCAPVAAPAVALLVAPWIAGPLAAVAVVPSLEGRLSGPGETVEEWWKRNSAGTFGNFGVLPTRTGLLLPLHVLRTPVIKFYIAAGSRLLLAFSLVAVSRGDAAAIAHARGDLDLNVSSVPNASGYPLDDAEPRTTSVLVFLWALAAAASEVQDMVTDYGIWHLDKLNVLELSGLVTASVGQGSAAGLGFFSPQTNDSIRSVAVLLLVMVQGLRLLQRSVRAGPLVLMCIRMTINDLSVWLLLAVAGVILPFAASILITFHGASGGEMSGECEGLDTTLSDPKGSLFVLLLPLVNSDWLVGCIADMANPATAGLLLVYLLLSVVLLLNLLIALFAKTFDTMNDTIDTLFQVLFATCVVTTGAQEMLPPPFNALQLPGVAYEALRNVAQRCRESGADATRKSLASSPSSVSRGGLSSSWTDERQEEDLDLQSDAPYAKEWREDNPLVPEMDVEVTFASLDRDRDGKIDPDEWAAAGGGATGIGDRLGHRATLADKVRAAMQVGTAEGDDSGRWRRQFSQMMGTMQSSQAELDRKFDSLATARPPASPHGSGGSGDLEARLAELLAAQQAELDRRLMRLEALSNAAQTDVGAKLVRLENMIRNLERTIVRE